ncbi:MAG: beta-galactosidase trimerization domain-containing protein [Bacteroidota bacterium]
MNKFLIFLLTLSACVAPEPEPGTRINDNSGTGYWFNQPLRIVQTVLREVDAKNYDTAALVEYLLETHANVLVINAGGIVDFFQNPLPAANINPFMGGRDLLKEIVTACHEVNIKVIGRVDFRGVEKHIYEEHPDWFGVDEAGDPIILNYTTPGLYAPCYLSYYRNEHAREFIGYLLEEYGIDGIWHNSVHVGGMCWCDRCRKDYDQKLGKSIPSAVADEALLDEYFHWKAGVADRYLESMRETVKSFGEDKAYAAEVFGMFDEDLPRQSGIDLYSGAKYFDFLLSVGFLSDNTTQIEYKDLGYPANHIRFLKSLSPEKQAVILFGTNGTSHRYMADPPEDLKIWMWETISAGGGLWNCNFTGITPATTLDTRNAFLTKVPYAYMENHRDLLEDQIPLAPVKILYSKSTRDYSGSGDFGQHDFGLAIRGMEKVLMEDHRPFGFIPDFRLDSAGLDGCELLILPDVLCLSDRQMEVITCYVEKGGNLLATHAASLYDENGVSRKDFGLSLLFGCSFEGSVFDTRKDSYQLIKERSELLDGFEHTTLLMNGGSTLQCSQTGENSRTLTTLVPVVNNQPPEKAWREPFDMDSPVAISNVYGKGKVVYFANEPDKLSASMGHNDFRQLLKNAIGTLQPEPFLVTNAPESVHINVTKNKVRQCYIITLINLTSAPERPIRSLLPVQDLEIEIRPEQGNEFRECLFLKAESGARKHKTGGGLYRIELDELSEAASFAIYYDEI